MFSKPLFFLSLWILLCCIHVVGQQTFPDYNSSIPINFQRTWIAQKPITTESEMVSPTKTVREVHQTSVYLDGLARPLQTVDKQASPQGKDMVRPKVYDAYGREQYQYLPFASNPLQGGDVANDGSFKFDAFRQQSAFSQGQYTGENYFYDQSGFEASPLNRTTGAFPAGNSWAGNTRGTTINYLLNTLDDNVQIWNIGSAAGSLPVSVGAYPAGKLDKKVATDAQGRLTVEYKDFLGQVILAKVQNSQSYGVDHTGWLCTYYIYDDMGNLRFVIQPKAVEQMVAANNWSISQTMADELCYRFEYDDRNRKSVEKNPGSGEIDNVYDIGNRLVFRQDANMRGSNQWLTTIYDVFDRIVGTGITTYGAPASQLQQAVTTQNSSAINNIYNPAQPDLNLPDPNTIGDYTAGNSITLLPPNFSTGASFSATIAPALNQVVNNNISSVNNSPIPSGAPFSVLTAVYYDDYSWTANAGLPSSMDQSHTTDATYFNTSYNSDPDYAQPVIQYASARGLTTGSMAIVLPADGRSLYTEKFYDDRGRSIQVQSTNITGGKDIATRQYDFVGKVLRELVQHQKNGNNPQTHTVLTKNSYDPMSRLVTITKTINSTIGGQNYSVPEKTIASYQYNEPGMRQSSIFGNNLEKMSYDYNIRGWVIGANRNYLKNTESHYFGFEVGYDNPATSITGSNYTKAEYDGSIGGVIWKTAGDQKARKYDFTYDLAGRMQTADFNQYTGSGFDKSSGLDFSVPSLQYDANGNITYMQQNGWKLGGSIPIDKLSYLYTSGGNRLSSVTEDPAIADMDNHLGDFTDKNRTDDDYSFDLNGNLKTDKNKHITGISYDFLNQPLQLTISQTNGVGTVSFTYDANGNKLMKTVSDQTISPVKTTTTTYIGGFVYENDDLQFLQHEEGRVRFTTTYPSPTTSQNGFVFDYFLKDQQSNTRVVLTEQTDVRRYTATMEPGSRANEDLLFSNIDNTSYPLNQASGYPNDVSVTNPNQNVARLDGTIQKVGPGIVLKVMSGDVVDVAVQYYYNNIVNNNTPGLSASDIVGSLANGLFPITGGSHGSISDMVAAGSPLAFALSSFLNNNNPALPSKPKAYLNWILLDNQFNYVSTYPQSGAKPVGNSGTSGGQLQTPLGYTGIPITTSGYLYVYVSNATPGWDVFFDNLSVVTHSGPMLEENHYYPFGLGMAGISDQALKTPYSVNKFRYNAGSELQSKEFSDGSGLEIYETLNRALDPQIGRWWQIDPKPDQALSPYSAMKNNPLLYNDPMGDTTIVDEIGNIKYDNHGPDNLVFEQSNNKLIQIGEFGKEIDISDILPALMKHSAAIAFGLRALGQEYGDLLWVQKVLPTTPITGEWDLKDNLETIFGRAWQFDALNPGRAHTRFLSKLMDFEDAADVGNYHAGYTGIYAGVPRLEQFKWAGLGELAKIGQNRVGWFSRFVEWFRNVPPYGDQLKDYKFNVMGMDQASKELKGDNKFQYPPLFSK